MGFHEADAVVWNVRLGRIVLLSQRKDRSSGAVVVCLYCAHRFAAFAIKLTSQAFKPVPESGDQLRNIGID